MIYVRVSTKKQADAGNLERQLERLRAYAQEKGYRVVAEIASQKEPIEASAELAQDLLAIVTSFAARLYGARGGRRVRRGFRELMRAAEEERQ